MKNIFDKDPKKIQIRLLCWKEMKTSEELNQMKNRGILENIAKGWMDINFFDFPFSSLIIHVHGGGFIAMSSSVH